MTARLIIFLLLFIVALISAQFLIYEPFIVPRLPTWKTVPIQWWLAMYSPLLLVCIVFAISCQSVIEWLLFCLLGVITEILLSLVACNQNWPGYRNCADANVNNLAIDFGILFIPLACFVGFIWFISKRVSSVKTK